MKFEILTAVNIGCFWDVMPCNLVDSSSVSEEATGYTRSLQNKVYNVQQFSEQAEFILLLDILLPKNSY
jgi:hypothetical protein